MTTTATDPAIVTAARRLGDLKTACWDAVRAFNADEGPASALYEASDALDKACEDFRRRFYPRAREVFAVCDHTIGQPLSVYRRTPSGRTVTVYDEAEVQRS